MFMYLINNKKFFVIEISFKCSCKGHLGGHLSYGTALKREVTCLWQHMQQLSRHLAVLESRSFCSRFLHHHLPNNSCNAKNIPPYENCKS